MTFGEIIEGIGRNLSVELVDEGGAAAVQVDGTPVILQAASDDLLLMHADLGEIAPEKRDRIFGFFTTFQNPSLLTIPRNCTIRD